MEVFLQVDLAECIEWQSVECLNEKSNHTFVNALKQVSTHLHYDYCSSKSRSLHCFLSFFMFCVSSSLDLIMIRKVENKVQFIYPVNIVYQPSYVMHNLTRNY